MTLQVWDIGGQTLGGKMLDKYVFGAHVSVSAFRYIDDKLGLMDWQQYFIGLEITLLDGGLITERVYS